jgi:hypothetical protein
MKILNWVWNLYTPKKRDESMVQTDNKLPGRKIVRAIECFHPEGADWGVTFIKSGFNGVVISVYEDATGTVDCKHVYRNELPRGVEGLLFDLLSEAKSNDRKD